jgi:hypothetical protein
LRCRSTAQAANPHYGNASIANPAKPRLSHALKNPKSTVTI